jgi:hypothetical protein
MNNRELQQAAPALRICGSIVTTYKTYAGAQRAIRKLETEYGDAPVRYVVVVDADERYAPVLVGDELTLAYTMGLARIEQYR